MQSETKLTSGDTVSAIGNHESRSEHLEPMKILIYVT